MTFLPDYARFGMVVPDQDNLMEEDTFALLCKRVYDVAATTAKSLKVWLNGEKLPIASFKEYVSLYLRGRTLEGGGGCKDGVPAPQIYTQAGERWEVAVSISDGAFRQVQDRMVNLDQ